MELGGPITAEDVGFTKKRQEIDIHEH